MKTPSYDELKQFTDRVKEALSQRLDAVSLRLDDAGLAMGGGEESYLFVGWATRPITGHRAQFKLDFTATIKDAKTMDIDPLVVKLAEQVTDYFYNEPSRIILLH